MGFPFFMKQLLIIAPILLLFGFIFSPEKQLDDYELDVPKGFPVPPIPEKNQLTTARVVLGKKLFFDPIMSRDTTVSCATCHKPELAFTDGHPTSVGIRGEIVTRNAPTLTNIVYHTVGLLHDRGVPTLEQQIIVPIQEQSEFDFDIKLIAERLKKDTSYVRMSMEAYGKQPNPYVITRALACFERTLISGNSRYDQYVNGDKKALNKTELKGKELFFEKLDCDFCHGGFNFTDMSLKNNGLYSYPYPLDSGRMRVTKAEEDRDFFKVPTLRNIGVTGPYMHDGSMATLDDVIEHYNSGGADHAHKDEHIKPLGLSKKEKVELKAFLLSLTDEEFISTSSP